MKSTQPGITFLDGDKVAVSPEAMQPLLTKELIRKHMDSIKNTIVENSLVVIHADHLKRWPVLQIYVDIGKAVVK